MLSIVLFVWYTLVSASTAREENYGQTCLWTDARIITLLRHCASDTLLRVERTSTWWTTVVVISNTFFGTGIKKTENIYGQQRTTDRETEILRKNALAFLIRNSSLKRSPWHDGFRNFFSSVWKIRTTTDVIPYTIKLLPKGHFV